jgi:hypothetical protein
MSKYLMFTLLLLASTSSALADRLDEIKQRLLDEKKWAAISSRQIAELNSQVNQSINELQGILIGLEKGLNVPQHEIESAMGRAFFLFSSAVDQAANGTMDNRTLNAWISRWDGALPAEIAGLNLSSLIDAEAAARKYLLGDSRQSTKAVRSMLSSLRGYAAAQRRK